ncbi:MAG: DciA family protein [Candidatus Sericytochromatia bacterium]
MYNFSSSLHKYLKKINVKDINKQKFTVVEMWVDIVGELFAKHSKAVFYKDKILNVYVQNSTYLNEILFFKDDFIDEYNKKFEREILVDIIFKIGNISKTDKSKDKKENDAIKSEKKEEKLYFTKHITDYEKNKIKNLVSNIKDDRLRESMENFFIKSREKELSLISQGWKKCLECKSLHNEKSDLCLICKSSIL